MKRAAVRMLMTTALIAGCAPPKPGPALLDHIESMLQRSPCVGSLERWSRHYAFQRREGRVDQRIIWIELAEAGHRGVPAGRYTDYETFDMIDDSEFRHASGEYDVAADRINRWSCGSNYPAQSPGAFPETDRSRSVSATGR